MNLSIVISAHNEEAKLAACLESLMTLDAEVVVMDHGSTDKTSEIAKKFTKQVFKTSNNPLEIDLQKNEGFSKATNNWILSLDADERLTPELCREIISVVEQSDQDVNGYFVPRKNIIFGKWIEHTGWYPDYQLRLFKKGQGKFGKKHVHEPLEVSGKTKHLTEPMLHENYDSIAQFLNKHFVLYAPNEADHLISSGYTFSWQDGVRMPVREFLSRYFARKGYLDGMHGLMLSIFMGLYHFVIFAFLWEKKQFSDKTSEINLLTVSEELRHAGRDTLYWIKKEKTDSEKNPLLRKLKKTFS